tara:strand:+ start:4119 stop:4934 length:816 start_codon:yes stop_codon:yes gene_type:complete
MPHGYLKEFKSLLAQFSALKVGDLLVIAIQYAEPKVREIINELLNQCPPPEVLKQMGKIVNNVNSLMNKVDRQVGQLEKLPKKLDKPIKIGKILVEILSHMPLPSSVPPGVGVPLGVIQSQSQLLSFTSNMINTLEDDQVAIKEILASASGVFTPIRMKISRIEMLLARCASNPNLSDKDRKDILDGLQDKNNSTTAGGIGKGVEYTSTTNGNTYTLSIVTNTETGISVPQRQAVAKDFRGIVVLKGPLSFASSEQVLIDELKFRIDNQLP